MFRIFLVSLLCSSAAFAEERIHQYDVDIRVQYDGSMTVTEKIRVTAEGNKIGRGIYRDFPTTYQDRLGNKYKVAFDVLNVTRNGGNEPYFTRDQSNGVRVYIGDSDRRLNHGEHTFTIRYRTDRQLGFFENHDELYWNAVGTGWAFTVDQANVQVSLPGEISPEQIELTFYTGPRGTQGQAARAGALQSGAWFETTAPLPPRHGLTIVVGFPKGIIEEPTWMEKLGYIIEDNDAVLAALVLLGLMVAYYYWAWSYVGRDLPAGTIIPRYKAPPGLSAAACRYVMRMGFDNRALTAAIISLAVKGRLKIEQEKKDYELHRSMHGDTSGSQNQLSKGEQSLLTRLFPGSKTKLELDAKAHTTLQPAQSALKRALKKEYQGKMFKTNGGYVAPGIVLGIIGLLIIISLGPPVYVLIGFSITSFLMLGIFLYLLKAPTPPGRRIMDEIEGLKMYLETAEGDRLNRMKSPELTPEVFESFLPYAYALDVANEWSAAFKNTLEGSLDPNDAYHPHWYHGGDAGRMNFLDNMGSNIGNSLSSSIASAATPPGSSSGGGGGGSSGGGGGGGGGGGW
jgi:uncharacterized protein (TIGR04222 family)